MILPVVDGVTVAVQLAVVSFFFNDTPTTEIYTLSLHAALPISTDPAGVEAVPGEMLSLTNTVHVTCWPTATEAGEHITTVDVARKPTVKMLMAGVLTVLRTLSLRAYTACAIIMPVVDGVTVAGQLAVVEL